MSNQTNIDGTGQVESSTNEWGDSVTVNVENVGGIEHCELIFSTGVTLLTGQNATNRTSFLQALNGILGGDMVTLRSECESGEVQLTTANEQFRIQLDRTPSETSIHGNPVTHSSDFVNRFVTLTRSNQIRQTVLNQGELRELLVGPGEKRIQEKIQSLERERRQVQQEIQNYESERDHIANELDIVWGSEDRLQELQTEYSDVEEELDELQTEISSLEEAIATSPELSDTDLQDIVDELNERTEQLETLEQQRARQRSRLQQKQRQFDELQSDLEEVENSIQALEQEFESDDTTELDIDSRIDSLQSRQANLQDQVNSLAGIMDFNERQLKNGLEDISGFDDVTTTTSQLDPKSQSIDCWTCGSRVQRSDIEEQISTLDVLEDELWDELDAVNNELETLRERREDITQQQRRYDELNDQRDHIEARIDTLSEEIDEHQTTIDDLDSSIDEHEEELAELEIQLKGTDKTGKHSVLSAHAKKSEFERTRGQLEQQLLELESKIEATEQDLKRCDELLSTREDLESKINNLQNQEAELRSEITDCKNRLTELERDTVEQFNQHMDQLLERLQFENISRIRLERYIDDSNESSFELKIARTSETGTVYEDTLPTLSESERETIGLVVALAGYLVHDVGSEVPFILLDALEPIDGNRIDALVEYFSQYSTYVIAAVLPEDEQLLAEDHDRISADLI